MKRPAFQFYPGDWQHDAALRSCSVGARGLWIEMMCIMHQAEPYGYLKVNHNPILPPILARMVGASEIEVQGWLDELSSSGVFSRDGDKIFSRRMVKDEKLRLIRAEGGKLGGNPALKDKSKVAAKDNHAPTIKDKQKPTPSSSSSSSSKKKIHIPPDFEISERVKKWAEQQGFAKLDEHLEAFKRKAEMNGYRYTVPNGWDLAFMEAVREDWAKLRIGNGKSVPGSVTPIIKLCVSCGHALAGGSTHMALGDVCNPCYSDYLAGRWDGSKPREPASAHA